jgi:hypothetical protein
MTLYCRGTGADSMTLKPGDTTEIASRWKV